MHLPLPDIDAKQVPLSRLSLVTMLRVVTHSWTLERPPHIPTQSIGTRKGKSMTGWTLDDVEVVAHTHPDTFFIPSETERKNQNVGNQVQLHFLLTSPLADQPRAERMWVKISKNQADGSKYEGILVNQPAYICDLRVGDTVQFEARHIAQVMIQRGDPPWVDCFEQAALVSKLVFDGDKTVRFAYREKPSDERDSGWRLLSGTETDEYKSNPKNIRICNIGWLIDFDSSLHEVLKNGFGMAFERAGKDTPWQRVKDWLTE
jgi:hypothetical protein